MTELQAAEMLALLTSLQEHNLLLIQVAAQGFCALIGCTMFLIIPQTWRG